MRIILILFPLLISSCTVYQFVPINPLEFNNKKVSILSSKDSLTLSGYWWENRRFEIKYDSIWWDGNNSFLGIEGHIIDKTLKLPLDFITVYIGSLDTLRDDIKISPKYYTKTDKSGRFIIVSPLDEKDKLIFLSEPHSGYYSCVYDVGFLFGRKH